MCAPDADLVVVTSEEPLLRGPVELRRFLERYVDGPTTYSWKWERHDVSTAGPVACLLAEGTEVAASGGRVERHPYRMTMVLELRDGRWLLTHVHGSSPQGLATPTPSVLAASQVAGRVIAAVNAKNVEKLRRLYAPEARTRRPGWPTEAGVEELLSSYQMDFAAVPDLRFEPLSTIASGERVATELRITGTNTGPTVLGDFGKALLGRDADELPGTGRSIDLNAVFIHEVRGDRVVAERQHWGLLEYLVQIGAVGGGR